MKKYLLAILLGIFYCFPGIAQSVFDKEKYLQVLYRINVGGSEVPAHDTTGINWITDNYPNPSAYSNFTTTGNKVYVTEEPIIYHESIPSGIPEQVFKNERSIEGWDAKSMEWDLPVEQGKLVEVRLYFAEIYFTTPGDRSFDIFIEGNLVENDIDLITTYGPHNAIMKSYEVIADGNLDIDLVQEKGRPTLAAIEIYERKSVTGIKIFEDNKPVSVYPNPFNDHLFINSVDQNISLFDASGNRVKTNSIEFGYNNKQLINTQNLEPGIYLLMVGGKGVKIIKK